MSLKTGRNESCPCGSGLKYKRCCALKEAEDVSKSGVVGLLVLLVLFGGSVIFAAVMVINGQLGGQELADQKEATGTSAQNTEGVRRLPSIPTLPTGSTPQPTGPVPAGKVWSPEHGHWHDTGVPGGHGSTSGQLTPQPPGEAPPGQVWSPEHGHYHDAE